LLSSFFHTSVSRRRGEEGRWLQQRERAGLPPIVHFSDNQPAHMGKGEGRGDWLEFVHHTQPVVGGKKIVSVKGEARCQVEERKKLKAPIFPPGPQGKGRRKKKAPGLALKVGRIRLPKRRAEKKKKPKKREIPKEKEGHAAKPSLSLQQKKNNSCESKSLAPLQLHILRPAEAGVQKGKKKKPGSWEQLQEAPADVPTRGKKKKEKKTGRWLVLRKEKGQGRKIIPPPKEPDRGKKKKKGRGVQKKGGGKGEMLIPFASITMGRGKGLSLTRRERGTSPPFHCGIKKKRRKKKGHH